MLKFESPDQMDGFDRLPDSLILDIFNYVGDVKTLIRCRLVSKLFNSLVSQADLLLLRVDRVDPPESPHSDSLIPAFFRSLFKSLHDFLLLVSKPAVPTRILMRSQNSPAQILSRFDRIRSLEIELPGGDLMLEKGAIVKWKAEFGRTLRSCVIVAFRSMITESAATPENSVAGGGEADADFARGLKTRVVWTISALIAASTRHLLLREVVKEHKEMEMLVLGDREGEGTLVMDGKGLKEYRDSAEEQEEERAAELEKSRTVVPSVRISMRYAPRLRLNNGLCLDGATLMVVRPIEATNFGAGADVKDAELASAAFGFSSGGGDDGGDDIYRQAVSALLKTRIHFLEMNSF